MTLQRRGSISLFLKQDIPCPARNWTVRFDLFQSRLKIHLVKSPLQPQSPPNALYTPFLSRSVHPYPDNFMPQSLPTRPSPPLPPPTFNYKLFLPQTNLSLPDMSLTRPPLPPSDEGSPPKRIIWLGRFLLGEIQTRLRIFGQEKHPDWGSDNF